MALRNHRPLVSAAAARFAAALGGATGAPARQRTPYRKRRKSSFLISIATLSDRTSLVTAVRLLRVSVSSCLPRLPCLNNLSHLSSLISYALRLSATKTRPTRGSVTAFLDSIADELRRHDCEKVALEDTRAAESSAVISVEARHWLPAAIRCAIVSCMNRRETEQILDAIRGARAAGQRTALATIVRIRGSAYRREGARIVVREDGSYECLLSGGCLEPAVAAAAARVIETGTPVLARYDLEEDSVWSLGVGCSGAVDILIERVGDDPVTAAWLEILRDAEPAVLVKPLGESTARLLVREHDVVGSLGSAALDTEASDRARSRLRAPFPASGPEQIGLAEVFLEVSVRPPELVLFGAGHDAEALARLGWDLGFAVTVADVREAFLSAERFPHAALVRVDSSRLGDAVHLDDRSFVVIMNHHLERDRECLRFALATPAPYIGVLGPRSRFAKLLARLRSDGFAPDRTALSRVRSPVGLALGAETPEEIAVSILGEMLALQRGFDGGFLNGRETSLHRSPGRSALARS